MVCKGRQKLLLHSGLYDEAVRNHLLERSEGWNSLTWMARELKALKMQAAVYLCNMETMTEEGDIGKDNKKRPLSKVEKDLYSAVTKKVKMSEQLESTEASSQDIEMQPSTSSTLMELERKSSSYDTDFGEEEPLPGEVYRFRLLLLVPGADLIQNEVCETWGIEKQPYLWDVIDYKEKKLVNVYITDTVQVAHEINRERISTCKDNHAYVVINPAHGFVTFLEFNQLPRGGMKVNTLAVERRAIAGSYGMIESNLSSSTNLVESVLSSSYINGLVKMWMDDMRLEETREIPDGEVYPLVDREVKAVKAKILLKNLCDPSKRTEASEITWRGKIYPEGFVENMYLEVGTDEEVVDAFIKMIRSIMPTITNTIPINMNHERSPDPETLLSDILRTWEVSEKNTFTVARPHDSMEAYRLASAAGFERKRRQYNPDPEGMKQPESVGVPEMKCSLWIEEVYKILAEPLNEKDGLLPMAQLLEESITDGHPINKLGEEAMTKLLKILLNTNAALYTSKLSGFYSRLGSSYRAHDVGRKKGGDYLAYMPIVAPIRDLTSKDVKKRLVHGICIRGPQHVKSPTDRIGLVTVEHIKNHNVGITMLANVNKGIVYLLADKSAILVRQNSIMKEDTCYQSFCSNSIFSVANNLGYMTFENQSIRQNEDMRAYVDSTLVVCREFLIERFIDGVMFCCIGNSRDEGYFANLRKLFMVNSTLLTLIMFTS